MAADTTTVDYQPINDGVDHINVHHGCKTELGKLLSNFSTAPFECEDGEFMSISAYWYWLSIVDKNDREIMRTLYGDTVKLIGDSLLTDSFGPGVDTFKVKICKAIQSKIKTHGIDKMLVQSDLPFAYYCVGDNVSSETRHSWVIVFIERLRARYKLNNKK